MAEINAKVRSELLQRLRFMMTNDSIAIITTSALSAMKHLVIITNKILDVLQTDTFGANNCHDEIFAKLDALDHFKICLPSSRDKSRGLLPLRIERMVL